MAVIAVAGSLMPTRQFVAEMTATESMNESSIELFAILPAPINVVFPDLNFATAVATELGMPIGTVVDTLELDTITTLVADGLGISSIVGAEHLTNLDDLRIDNNAISDLTPLSNLANLTYLSAENNSISVVSPLATITSLRWLLLSGNQIENVSSLNSLINLERLILANNSLGVNEVLNGLSSLNSLNNLEGIDLSNNSISDISMLGTIASLKNIVSNDNLIADVSGLNGLANLTHLYLNNNKIININAINNLPVLDFLFLENNEITDFSGLSVLPNLHYLIINNNKIADISYLHTFPGLWGFELENQEIENAAMTYATNISSANIVIDEFGSLVSPNSISDSGVENGSNIEWTLGSYVSDVNYTFSRNVVGGNGLIVFSGKVIQPLSMTYTVTYNGNGSDGGIVPVDATPYLVGATVIVQVGTPTLSGHTFVGWEYGGLTYLAGSTIIMPATNITLTAQWTPIPTYTVTYNGSGNDGGIVPVDATPYLVGATVIVQSGTPTLAGHTFVGWEYGGLTYLAGSTIIMPASNIILTAQWTPIPTYTVTYNGSGNDGGIVPVDTTPYLVGDIVIVLAGTPTLAGHTFTGWEYGGLTYLAGSTIIMPASNIILTAQWTPIPTYTVTYNGNGHDGGVVPVDGTAYLVGATVIVQAGTPTLAGHTFTGWEYGGLTYLAGSTIIMPASNITLTAQWLPIPPPPPTTYTVTYNGNGHDGGIVPIDGTAYLVGATVTVQAGTPTLAGHTFIGWEYNGTIYPVGSTITMPASNITLTAQWFPIPPPPTTYTVTYNGNGNDGGVVPTDTTAHLVGAIVTVQSGTQTLIGHIFAGWEYNGTTYLAGDTIIMPATNITLTAQWTALPPPPLKIYRVTYGGNGSDGGVIPKDTTTYKIGDLVTVQAGVPIRDGHIFTGWEYNGVIYHQGDTFTMNGGNIVFTATWKKVNSKEETPNIPNLNDTLVNTGDNTMTTLVAGFIMIFISALSILLSKIKKLKSNEF
jgi:Listeria/Bacterioides repeat